MKKIIVALFVLVSCFGAVSTTYAATHTELVQAFNQAQTLNRRINEVRLDSMEDVHEFIRIASSAGYNKFSLRAIHIAKTNQTVYGLRFW